jgi:hypothetical protein
MALRIKQRPKRTFKKVPWERNMGELVSIEFRSKELRVDRSIEKKVQECLTEFENTASFQSAQKLRQIALPTSEFFASRSLPDGKWVVEIRYDNLLHEGEGSTQAAALVDAVIRIAHSIRNQPQANSG